MSEYRPTYGATPPDDGTARCPECGAYPAGHSKDTCRQVLKYRIEWWSQRCQDDMDELVAAIEALKELEGERG